MDAAGDSRQIVLLRGVNVGTGNRIAMADLRALLTDLGHTAVRTHLNSGNAVVTAPTAPAATATAVAEALSRQGLRVAVVVVDADRVTAALADNPFAGRDLDPSRLLVGFLQQAPAPEVARQVQDRLDELTADAPDEAVLVADHLYLSCPDSITSSPFAKLQLDRLLGTPTTTRNLRTVQKLAELVTA
jgi:uncharacterized protein (DUF1697 family)